MGWISWIRFLFVSLGFYIAGRKDGEDNSVVGLTIWLVCVVAMFVWTLATTWALRGQ